MYVRTPWLNISHYYLATSLIIRAPGSLLVIIVVLKQLQCFNVFGGTFLGLISSTLVLLTHSANKVIPSRFLLLDAVCLDVRTKLLPGPGEIVIGNTFLLQTLA